MWFSKKKVILLLRKEITPETRPNDGTVSYRKEEEFNNHLETDLEFDIKLPMEKENKRDSGKKKGVSHQSTKKKEYRETVRGIHSKGYVLYVGTLYT